MLTENATMAMTKPLTSTCGINHRGGNVGSGNLYTMIQI